MIGERETPMRVLFVAPYAPTRIRVRTFGFIRELARQHEVTVVALAHGSDRPAAADIEELRSLGVTILLVHEPRYAPPLRALRSVVRPAMVRPLQVEFAAAPLLRAAIEREISSGRYDVLHVEHIRGLGALPAAVSLPVVWDAVDCVSLLFEESARAATNPLLRLVSPLEAQRLRAYERRQLPRFERVLITSERDKQALLALRPHAGHPRDEAKNATVPTGSERIVVLPHGLDRSYFLPYHGPREQGEVIFSGKMSYHANIAGARLLAERVMPLIWRTHPEAHLTIAGAHPAASVRRLARDRRITVTGYVPDMRPLIASAQVSVSPLPYAVGIQNKILEAMALRTPVVASASAARGLDAVAGQDLLVGESAEELASAVCRVLEQPTLAEALADAGARYVDSHHDWSAIVDQLTATYERVCAVGAATRLTTVIGAATEAANGTKARTPAKPVGQRRFGLPGAHPVTP